jgi:hypothetical protein
MSTNVIGPVKNWINVVLKYGLLPDLTGKFLHQRNQISSSASVDEDPGKRLSFQCASDAEADAVAALRSDHLFVIRDKDADPGTNLFKDADEQTDDIWHLHTVMLILEDKVSRTEPQCSHRLILTQSAPGLCNFLPKKTNGGGETCGVSVT